MMANVAQLVEPRFVVPVVVGLGPPGGPPKKKKTHPLGVVFFFAPCVGR